MIYYTKIVLPLRVFLMTLAFFPLSLFSQEATKEVRVFKQHKKSDVQDYLDKVTVRNVSGKVHINWTAVIPSLKKDEFIYYSVERSKDDFRYECILLKQGKLPPEHIDETPFPGISYYRIRVVLKQDGYTYYLEGKSYPVMNGEITTVTVKK